MNVCMLTIATPAHGKGGAEDHALMLAKGIAAKDHSVTVITTAHPDKDYEIIDGIKIYYLKRTIPQVCSRTWWIESSKKVLELHELDKFDLLHCQNYTGYYFLIKKYNRQYNLPTVMSLHGTPLDEVVSRINIINSSISKTVFKHFFAILYWIEKYFWVYLRCAPKADGVIATSNELARLIRTILFVSDKKLYKVFNGMDLGLFSPGIDIGDLLERLGINEKTKVLLCVARFVQDKGIDNAIKSLPYILKKYNDLRLVLVGDGRLKEYLIKLTHKLGVADYVSFQGYVDFEELPKYFNLCDIFINATIRRNGYDLTMLEAMACQKVVVSSNIGSTPTLISNGIDGVLVPVGKVKVLAKEVINVLDNQKLAHEIGKNARQKALKDFSLDKMVEDTIKTYYSVLENKSL